MKIGVREIFSTERTKHQFVTTKFFFLGLPLFPVKSYFVHDKIIELGSFPIPLNRKNVIKNYLSVYLSIMGFLMLIFNFFLNDNLILGSEINPYYYELLEAGIPIGIIEKLITLVIVFLAVYFIFYYGRISQEEKEERSLIQKTELWKMAIPGKSLIPILAKYYTEEEQEILMNQLTVLLFRLKVPLNDEEKEELQDDDMIERVNKFDGKLYDFIDAQEYKGKTKSTVALLFLILSIKRRLYPSSYHKQAYQNVKRHLVKITSHNTNTKA